MFINKPVEIYLKTSCFGKLTQRLSFKIRKCVSQTDVIYHIV